MKPMKFGLGLMAGWLLGITGAAVAQDGVENFVTRPSEQHERLKNDVGTWDATMKVFMAGPDAEPTVSKGVETNRLFGGGLWIVSEFEADFLGQKFQGRGQTGYDSKKGKYVGTWIDSMTDRITLVEGAYDPAVDAVVMYADVVDMVTGEPVREKHVLKRLDDETREFTMSQPGPDGKDVVTMQILYKKRKG